MFLIGQLHYGKLPPLDPLFLEESQARYGVPDLRCTAEVAGLLLQVVPPTVGHVLQSLLL
jgi:hypothetical protein